jgi:predicted phage tail protein
MQRVRLLGELGERFGAEYTYHNLRHPADAIKLLCINRPDFKDYLLSAEENGIGFKVIQGGEDMGYEDLLLPFGQNDLTIVPVVSGSGDSFGQILLGIGLIAISFLLPGAGLFGAASIFGATAATAGIAGTLTTIGTALSAVGASLILGGVANMLSPQPRIPDLSGDRFGSGSRNRTGGPTNVTRGVDGVQSYAYTGAANTVGVGATVPLAYGKVLIGSHLLRSKVEVADESDPPLNSIKKSGPDTFLIGGEKLTTEFSDVSGAVVKRVFPDKTTFGSAGSITNTSYATVNQQSLVATPNTQSPFPNITNTTTSSSSLALFGLAEPVTTTATQPVAPAFNPFDISALTTTTTPTVTNATTNILATGTNSSSATLSVPGLNSLRSNFNVAFNLANGLFNYAAGVNTTLVDAFITYEIAVYKDSIDPVNLMAVDQASIQALLMPVQDNITWMHKMELPELSYTNAVVQVKIIDTDAYTPGMNGNTPISLNLLAIGFELT